MYVVSMAVCLHKYYFAHEMRFAARYTENSANSLIFPRVGGNRCPGAALIDGGDG